MSTPEKIVEDLFRLLRRDARKSWFRKPRYDLDAALRAAYAGWDTGAGDEMMLAALLRGIGPRLAAKGLPSLEASGFSARVCALAGGRGEPEDERLLKSLFEIPAGATSAVPMLDSYRALAMGHLGRATAKDP